MADLQLELNAPLELRIQEFKNDPEKMQDVNDFLTELFKEAQREAEQRNGNKQKGKLDALGIQNGTKRIGASFSRARSSARTFATRIFTTICNCTNQVKSAVTNRN
ncbi:uncharacterized protein LOC109609069 [Aethina tumida]|uniref:uncharacterized protein LOC109609069 n=1 Tax=Aethina tumida TaxID=116153 RepID=UPI00096AFFB5|nr:uncharacterized protein LOC109609069 [Aethina tumida]